MKCKVGETYFGKVTRKEGYGVFVRLGSGQVGLVHYNQLRGDGKSARSRRLNAIAIGDEMAVDVIGISDGNRQRVDLSERTVFTDIVFAQLPLGEELFGEVLQVTDFGAFVLLDDWDVTALLHASEVKGQCRSERDSRLSELRKGDRISVFATSIELDDGRIRLRCCEDRPKYPFEVLFESIPASETVTNLH